ncbi:MAG: DUF6320 domain-containing protein [Bacteroidales bacterium]
MKTCSNCGVDLEGNVNFCPLCGEPHIDESADNIEYIKLRKQKQDEKHLTSIQKLSGFQKRKLFWEISGILLLSGIVVTLIIDLLDGNAVGWSKYTMTVCAVLFINTTLFCFCLNKPALLLLGSFASTSVLLILIDLFNGSIGWGIKLGIPILLIAYLIIYGLILMIRKAREKELNLITYSLIASGLLSICVEGMISIYNDNILKLQWSLIVLISVMPVSLILLYIQYRMKKGTDLKRFFHI